MMNGVAAAPDGGPAERSPLPVQRIGIIGAGAAAHLHLHALRRLPGLQVVAIRDLDRRRAAALASAFGLAPGIADPDRFHESGPQSVHIVTPPDTHEALALEAMQRGAHVLVEKPAALTLAGCNRLLAAAARAGVSIGVNENTAFEPPVCEARRLIDAGTVGRLLQIDGLYSFALPPDARPPAWMDVLPGGMLEDLLPHLLTTARAIARATLVPDYWRLVSTRRLPGHDDELRLLLHTGDGVSASLSLSLTAVPKSFTMTVRGTRATLAIDLRHMLLHVLGGEGRGGAVGAGIAVVNTAIGTLWQTAWNAAGVMCRYRERHGSFFHHLRAHYAALRAGEEIPTPLHRAMQTVAISRQIWPGRESGSGRP